ncbi:DUF6894 family protein [Bradyrhizobium sp.]|uniref:DUF6894 family protein n=1 Tax=Bradyrhizobium sp. TaxID=376 RepID=UPI003C6F67CB
MAQLATPLFGTELILCWLCFQMPLYRFNLEDHHFIADRGVHDCVDEEHAGEIADEIADRLVQIEPELVWGGHAIVVRNEHNVQVYRANMDRTSIHSRRRN